MKNDERLTKQMFVGWVGNKMGEEIFAVIDSSPITAPSCVEAEYFIAESRFVQGFVPAVFLDQQLDSPAVGLSLQSEATRRFVSTKSRSEPI